MKLLPTRLPGVVLIEPSVLHDDRGWFTESYNRQRFNQGLAALGLPPAPDFVQDNESSSRRGVLRGLHYQLAPHAQGKLVRVTQGAVFDVCVDIRRSSPHFGQSLGVELSAENGLQLWIPEGFAHGFLALQDDSRFQYKTTNFYARDSERSILWNDPGLAIWWPDHLPLQLAPKDTAAPAFATADVFD